MPESGFDMRGACLTIVLAFTSCGGEPGPSRPEPPATETSDHAAPSADPASDPSAVPSSAEAPSTPSEPPELMFVASPEAHTIALSIANHGSALVSLRAAVAIEVAHDGTFAPTASSRTLRYDCEHEADRCVTLAPGAELLPPDCGHSGSDPGSYRFVVTTCDGSHRVESNVVTR